MIRRRLVITGRVQNVFFRDWMTQRAEALGIAGWVRNRHDGSVEAMIEGPPEMVEALVRVAHDGSAAARVDRVDVTDEPPGAPLRGFEQRPTA